MEKKKAEVRRRMEEQSKSKKKKGFMTPERKKKLRVIKLKDLHLATFAYVQLLDKPNENKVILR